MPDFDLQKVEGMTQSILALNVEPQYSTLALNVIAAIIPTLHVP